MPEQRHPQVRRFGTTSMLPAHLRLRAVLLAQISSKNKIVINWPIVIAEIAIVIAVVAVGVVGVRAWRRRRGTR